MQDGSHPIGEGFDGLVGRGDGGCIDRDEVRLGVGSAGSIFGGMAVHEAILTLLDPLDRAVQTIAHGDAEVREVDVLDVPFGSCLESVFVLLDPIGQPLDLLVKGTVSGEVLFGSGFEGANEATAYDPKY